MKKLLGIIVLGLLLSGNAYSNPNEIILYCVDKIKSGSEGKLYDKEVSYKRENFILKLDLIKKNIKIDDYHYFEENFDLLLFSTRLGSTIRLQELRKTKRWQYYRSSVMALGDSIYISSGICKNFK
tara:strand:- start:201 stop:578 length:378 start_codon:yes stop_codon:yes gene_type:complete